MASTELEVVRKVSTEFIVQTLPDGSAALFEVATKNVYSLNPSAAAAWEACASPLTVAQLAAAMSRRLNAPVTEELAHEAVAELVTVGLATVTSTEAFGTSRRAMLKQVAGVALPVVLVLTGAEQKAHAQGAGSNPPPLVTTTQAPGTTPTPPGNLEFCIAKSLGVDPREPQAGVKFDVKDGAGTVFQLETGPDGKTATVLVTGGTITMTETDAPGGLALYNPPFDGSFSRTFVYTPDQAGGSCRDVTNTLKS